MPYIDKARRSALFGESKIDYDNNMQSSGELNYIITKILQDYIETKDLSYQTINDIIGVLEGAKLEFYRRVVVPYENKKIEENGDVYDGEDSNNE